jgi:pantoate kinase
LSAAIAINHRFSLGHTLEAIAMIAHEAEVRSGSGVGDVASQVTGGVARRTCLRGPLDAVAVSTDVDRLAIRHFGPLRTKDVLRNPDAVRMLASEGAKSLEEIDRMGTSMSIHRILDISLGFARASGLVTDERVAGCIEDIKATGESATMVMLGHVVLATAATGPGSEWWTCGVDHQGARLI